MGDCVFCKIIAGEIPSYKLYEDASSLVILDAFPGTRAHTLVLPKAHYRDIFDTPTELYGQLMELTKRVAKSMNTALNYDGINIMQHNGSSAGQTVFHLHIHLFPRWSGDNALGGWKPGQMKPGYFEELTKLIIPEI